MLVLAYRSAIASAVSNGVALGATDSQRTKGLKDQEME